VSDERDLYDPPDPHKETPKDLGGSRVRMLRRTLVGQSVGEGLDIGDSPSDGGGHGGE
jgi:hypothetical protein